MADIKNIITLGIGCNPGKLLWFITTGLESASASAFNFTDPRVVFENKKTAEMESIKSVTLENRKTVSIT